MVDNTAIAYAEVDEILNLLEDYYIEKVPEKVRIFLEKKEIKIICLKLT